MTKALLIPAAIAAAMLATPTVAQSIFPDGAAGTGIEGTEEGTPRVTDDTTTTETKGKGRGNGNGRNR